MSAPQRPQKTIRLNYIQNAPNRNMAAVTVFGSPAEVRVGANPKQFLAVNELTGITFSPGLGKHINIQALPSNMRYGGMLMDLPFPLSITPVTPVTPLPKQFFAPPLLGLMPTLVQIAALAALFPA